MPGPAAILREIHRLRKHTKDLQTEIERLPRLLKGQQAKVARQEEAAKQAHEQIKHLKVSVREKEGLVKQTHQLITKHERQLNEASGKKEYDALKVEIASERAKVQRTEDEILNTLMEIDDRTAKLPESDRAAEQLKVDYAEYERTQGARQQVLAEQLQQAMTNLKEVEASLPDDIRNHYERQVSARGDEALSAVENRVCLACYTEITAQNHNDLIQGNFVMCKSCGRILYLTE